MPSWNMEEETNWLIANYLPRFKEFSRVGTVEMDGETLSPMVAFKIELVREFGKEFSYRHPETDVSEYPVELQNLQFTDPDEWEGLGEKFRNRLNYLKGVPGLTEDGQPDSSHINTEEPPVEIKKTAADDDEDSVAEQGRGETPEIRTGLRLKRRGGRKRGAGRRSVGVSKRRRGSTKKRSPSLGLSGSSPRAPVQPEVEMADAPSQSASTRVASQVPQLAPGIQHEYPQIDSSTIPTPAPEDYKPTVETVNYWKHTLEDLTKMADTSWAECSTAELKRRQEMLPYIMSIAAKVASHGTGAEIFTTGVTANRKAHVAFNTASSQSYPFLNSKVAEEIRGIFTTYTSRFIGPAMCVSPRCPGVVVYGDPNRGNHPVLPPSLPSHEQNQLLTHQYLSLKMQWQGGGSEVPYNIIAQEAAMGRYSIVTRAALPAPLEFLQDPMTMSKESLDILMDHLRASDRGDELPPKRRFQFNEPAPGWCMQIYRTDRNPFAVIDYPPESWAYALFLQDLESDGPPPREDGLPEFSEEDPPYLSFGEDSIEMWKHALVKGDSCIDLFNALQAHDYARPHHSSEEDWNRRAVNMPHLKEAILGADDSIEHIPDPKGWLHHAFYTPLHPDHAHYGLAKLLAWGDPENFTHKASQTIEGGPLGCKWAALVFAHVRRNTRLVREGNYKVDAHYGTQPHRVQFTDADVESLDKAINKLLGSVQNSTAILMASRDERCVTNRLGRALRDIEDRHKRFPKASEGVHLRTITEAQDAWENAVPHPLSPGDPEPMEIDPPINQAQDLEVISLAADVKQKGKAVDSSIRRLKRPLSRSQPTKSVKERRVQFHSDKDQESIHDEEPHLSLSNLEISPWLSSASYQPSAGGSSHGSASGYVMEVSIPVKTKRSKVFGRE
ncbi:Dynein heavy chain 9, axonemal [Rhizoctonia solani]|uniref:Dynein heavy chain 9, axonemal n=1 Tax=Rhizoctonia solani TaxID=456999 RepID=A0A0K6GCX3_9AGAM|nr:Dynein heavy chain 9, axonemal [Rhizoctonia solani]